MGWEQLDISSRHNMKVLEGTGGTTRFVLDNDVDHPRLFSYLDGQGISAVELPARLKSRDDASVLAHARAIDRVLLTHDSGFLNMQRHPPESNSGIVLMPGGSGDVEQHLPLIGRMLRLMLPNP